MNLTDILNGVKKAGSAVSNWAQPEDINSSYANWALPLAAIIEGGMTGQTSGTQGQIDMLSGLPAAKEDYRQKSLERQLGITQAEGKQKFLKGAAESPENLVDLYSRYGNPEEAAKVKLTSMEKLKQILSSPEKMTDFQRKYTKVKEAHPDWTEDQVLDYTLVPSSQVGPSEEKLQGAEEVSYRSQKGALRPDIQQEKTDLAAKESYARGQAEEQGKRAGGVTVPPATLEKVTDADKALAGLEQIKTKFNKEWAIPFVGQPINDVLSKVSSKRADFQTTAQRYFNDLMRSRYGAQISAQDKSRILAEVGDLSVTPDVYQARLENNIDFLRNSINQRKQVLGEAGYHTGGLSTTEEPLDETDPRVKKARDAGYTDDEIRAYLKRKK